MRGDDRGQGSRFSYVSLEERIPSDHPLRPMSSDHFKVDGTLIEAWASHKSFQPKKGRNGKDKPGSGGGGSRNETVSFHGQKRLNDTHASTTDPVEPDRRSNDPA